MTIGLTNEELQTIKDVLQDMEDMFQVFKDSIKRSQDHYVEATLGQINF